MLHRMADKQKHTFADDMESLFYVVQYSAFLWQPHAFNQQHLTVVISRLFDDAAHGGVMKRQDLFNRACTRNVNFESKALGEWLESMMIFRSPLKDTPEEDRNKWSDPASIDAFWADFLRTHTLETDNRVVHALDTTEYLNSRSPGPRADSSSGSEAHSPHRPRSQRKRGRARADSSSEPPQRNLRPKRATRDTRDSTPPVLRRSVRIRDIQHKVQA